METRTEKADIVKILLKNGYSLRHGDEKKFDYYVSPKGDIRVYPNMPYNRDCLYVHICLYYGKRLMQCVEYVKKLKELDDLLKYCGKEKLKK